MGVVVAVTYQTSGFAIGTLLLWFCVFYSIAVMWWLLLFLVPLVNVVILIIMLNDLSKSFGHGVGFTFGLIFLSLIFAYILAFGSSAYRGPAGATGGMAMAPPPLPMPAG